MKVKKTNQPDLTPLPARAASHKVDTKAVRLVMSQLDENWLIRGLEERDYGIDLQLEYFDDNLPTGLVTFIQIKGTEKSFEADESFDLPVKTLLYAELFSPPFFLFRTSLEDGVTRFAWLQKFATTTLPLTSPRWRYQDTVKISIPEDNDLVENSERFKRIVFDQRRQRMGVEFLKIEFSLSHYGNEFLRSGDISALAFCSAAAKKLVPLEDFIIGHELSGKSDAKNLVTLYELFDHIFLTGKITKPQRTRIVDALELIETIKISYMHEDEIHAMNTKKAGIIYY